MPAGVITLYHPNDSMISGICQYVSCLNPCYIIDNSLSKNEFLLKKIKSYNNVIYINNAGNKGVAHALNQAVNLCKKQKIKWLLLMDQDSIISPYSVNLLYQYAITYDGNDLGIVAANYKPQISDTGIEKPLEVITSGSLLNVDICVNLGGFCNELFIDEVDNEYCLRLNLEHFRIHKLNYVLFQHVLGNKQTIKGVVTYNYPPIRYYYIIRNTLYVSNKYKENFPLLYLHKQTCIEKWVKMIFYEKYTFIKLLFVISGVIDYKRKKLGICSWGG